MIYVPCVIDAGNVSFFFNLKQNFNVKSEKKKAYHQSLRDQNHDKTGKKHRSKIKKDCL